MVGSQSAWQIDDRYYLEDGKFSFDLIRSQMKWTEVNPGRMPPPFWPTDQQRVTPLTNEDWMACQDSIKHKLVDPTICNPPPIFCYDNILIPGCYEQAVWKKDNMWSPRRGFGAAVANDKIFVIGGRAREYARIHDTRLVGGISGQRIESMRDHSTIREEEKLKNDVWSSDDQGRTWKLVNPGCKDHQQDILLETEVWSRNSSDPFMRKNVGSIGSKCFLSSDCAGVAECRALGNTNERVCVCPMFSPRERHTLSVQRRFSIQDDGSVYEEDVMYVVGGFSSVKQAFCEDRSCGPADGYKVALDDVWMSADGVDWVQIKNAFDSHSSFVGRGGHTSLVIRMSFGNNTQDERDRLLIFGGKTAHPQELSTIFLNDIWELPLPTTPCCKPSMPCAGDFECVPRSSDLNVLSSNAEWAERSGHVTVYEPPSSTNSFQPRVYLSGGENANNIFSDVWCWSIGLGGNNWRRDFASNKSSNSTTLDITASSDDSYLSIDSPLSALKRFELPSLDLDGTLNNFSAHSVSPILTNTHFAAMSDANISTIEDLAHADLYTVLKLRGFDYPGRVAREGIPNICLLREVALEVVRKCALKATTTEQPNTKSTDCGRGGDTIPCSRDDWDGCSPMEGVSVVDVHGLGNVKVPVSIDYNLTSSMVEELFCRQQPPGRTLAAGAFFNNKFGIIGGLDSHRKRLYRDVWTRDEESPRAIITKRPASFTPQFQFFFDSNEDGAHVFEYKLFRDGQSLIDWTTTTASIGVDVSWLDDKKGGPGKGWYTIFVRAIDPAGNRDSLFSTKTNVARWLYVPPIPWAFVAGGIITGLVLIVGGYFEYRRRRRKAILQRFALRRLKRKFKLKEGLTRRHSAVVDAPPSLRRERRAAEFARQTVFQDDLVSGQQVQLRKRHDRPRSGTMLNADEMPRTSRSASHSASRRSRSGSRRPEGEHQERRKARKDAADIERRRRRRRDREKNRRRNLRE